jgi:hypothetical protein
MKCKFTIMTEKKEQQEELTKEEVLAWYADQIELAAVRRDLAQLQCEATEFEAKRLQAAMMIGQIKIAEEEMAAEMAAQEEPTLGKVED